MDKNRSAKRILDYAPSFRTGVTSVLRPGKRLRQLRKAIMSMEQNDGLYEDWQAVGQDLHIAIDKFQSELVWQRK